MCSRRSSSSLVPMVAVVVKVDAAMFKGDVVPLLVFYSSWAHDPVVHLSVLLHRHPPLLHWRCSTEGGHRIWCTGWDAATMPRTMVVVLLATDLAPALLLHGCQLGQAVFSGAGSSSWSRGGFEFTVPQPRRWCLPSRFNIPGLWQLPRNYKVKTLEVADY